MNIGQTKKYTNSKLNIMEVSLLEEIKSTNYEHQSATVNKIENEENIILICFDPNNEFNQITQDFKIRLYQINDSIIFHTKLELCIDFLGTIKEEKILLITSASSASQIFSNITLLNQINSTFIFCSVKDHYGHIPFDNPKLIGIFNKLDSLCTSIKERIDLVQKRGHLWCFFNQNEYKTKDLSKQSNDFLWLQLFHAFLLHLPCHQQIKRQKINSCRHSYQRIIKLTSINNFEYEYQPTDAIRWFMKYPILRKTINKALQTEDINQLYSLRYFLSDLLQNLRHEHQQILQCKKKNNLVVYQEIKLSNEEFNQLEENKGKLISMKGFLIATTQRPSSRKETNMISALFEIECDLKELNEHFIFGDITHFNEASYQQTILFDLNSTFRLESIEENEEIWIIKLKGVNDGEMIKQKYISDTHRQIEDLSIPILFGKLICDMSQWNQSKIYFEHLLNDLDDGDLAWIEHSLGQVHHWKGEWNEALKYYDRAYDRMMKSEPVRIKDSALVLSAIGEILYNEGKYEEAYNFYQRALTIQRKYYSDSHVHIAASLENIGHILQRRLKDNDALVFFQQALIIQEKYYNDFHVDIAKSLSNIAYNLTSHKKYDEALDYYQRAMSIYKKYYPSGHVHIADVLNNIADVFYRQSKFDEGLDILLQALTMRKKYYLSDDVNLATSLINVGNIKYDQKEYNESLKLHYQALAMLKKYYSCSHIFIAYILNNIGDTQLRGIKNFNEALRLHQQALTILETYYPSHLAHIAITLNYIGDVFRRQEKNDEAVNFYQRALKMQEEYNLSYPMEIVSFLGNTGNTSEDEQTLIVQNKNSDIDGYVNMANSLNGIGKILEEQTKYDEALNFYQRSLMIREKFYPSNHALIAANIRDISIVLFHQQKYEEAFDFEQRALKIRESHNPPNYVRITESINQMGNIRFHQEKYDEAYKLFQQVLEIYEKYSRSCDIDIVFSLGQIGCIKYNESKFDEALDYFHRAMNILKEFDPTNHIEMSYYLQWIGFVCHVKASYDDAIEYYKQCLRILESSDSPEYVSIIDTLSRLGHVKRTQHQYEHSLTYELKCFLIREKVLPPFHEDIGASLSKIAECYDHLNRRKLALDYYKRALIVYEQCLPSGHHNRSRIESKIQELSEGIVHNNNI